MVPMDKKPSKKASARDGRAQAEQAPPLSPPGVALPRGAAPSREETLALVPVRNMVLFPGVVLPVVVSRPKSIETVMDAVRRKEPLALVLQKDEKVEEPRRDDLHDIGTVAEIVRHMLAPDGKLHLICQGEQRFELLELVDRGKTLAARIKRLDEESKAPPAEKDEARFLALKEQAREVLQLSPGAPEDLANVLMGVPSPALFADMVTTFLDVPLQEKQEILATLDVAKRLAKVSARLAHLVEVLRLSQQIRERTKGTLDKAQREYYLREQLKQIHKELGVGENGEHEELAQKLAACGMPPEVEKEARKELARLARLPEGAAEQGSLRTWLETMVELPWREATTDTIDIAAARAILDADHHGLEKVKRQILEYLAVRKLAPEGKRANLCLVGPPGVGKTSLGHSIARAMGRKFVRVSLGGVHDEAEIRGHRRTYVGALPGKIVAGLKQARSKNPVFMLDEIDKLGVGMHGDPASALLEVLDPEQNHSFRDNYLGVPIDLSKVLFIATANVLEQVPPPLRDRFEVVQLVGYTREEKLEIARRYLLPRQLADNGLDQRRCKVGRDALEAILEGWVREAGVRQLERRIGSIVRHVAARVAEGKARGATIGRKDLAAILGPAPHADEQRSRTSVPGVATGLAWTPVGGEILHVEATSMPGKGQLILTGQLGEVMRESAQAALSLVKSRSRALGFDPRFFETHDLHVHLPAGAIQKDGPSAGVALYTALCSLLSGRLVRPEVAMTGEISLRGLVLPVGGIKEKVLGARAAGIRQVVLPERNRAEADEVPQSTRAALEFRFVRTVDEVLELALVDPPAAGGRRRAPRRKAE
jgi:ATP-dependent Lon protease